MRMVFNIIFVACLLTGAVEATASGLSSHFLPTPCRVWHVPVLIVTDTTQSGEIDDSITLLMYEELERRGCVQVIGIVPIFGNGGSSTQKVEQNLRIRLAELGLASWKSRILSGPSDTMHAKLSASEHKKLFVIAHRVNQHHDVVVAELGPMTLSARLLSEGLVNPKRIARILGVGGRLPGERFSTGTTLVGSLFGFRDMNVAEDTNAMRYLLARHSQKLWMTTYGVGLGDRMVNAELIAESIPALTEHARRRARTMKFLGYEGIPLWDTLTTSYFIQGGEKRLGCRSTTAGIRYDGNGFRDPFQLWIDLPQGTGKRIVVCHDGNK